MRATYCLATAGAFSIRSTDYGHIPETLREEASDLMWDLTQYSVIYIGVETG